MLKKWGLISVILFIVSITYSVFLGNSATPRDFSFNILLTLFLFAISMYFVIPASVVIGLGEGFIFWLANRKIATHKTSIIIPVLFANILTFWIVQMTVWSSFPTLVKTYGEDLSFTILKIVGIGILIIVKYFCVTDFLKEQYQKRNLKSVIPAYKIFLLTLVSTIIMGLLYFAFADATFKDFH